MNNEREMNFSWKFYEVFSAISNIDIDDSVKKSHRERSEERKRKSIKFIPRNSMNELENL